MNDIQDYGWMVIISRAEALYMTGDYVKMRLMEAEKEVLHKAITQVPEDQWINVRRSWTCQETDRGFEYRLKIDCGAVQTRHVVMAAPYPQSFKQLVPYTWGTVLNKIRKFLVAEDK